MGQFQVVHVFSLLVAMATVTPLPAFCHSLPRLAHSTNMQMRLFDINHFKESIPSQTKHVLPAPADTEEGTKTLLSKLSLALLTDLLTMHALLKTHSRTRHHANPRALKRSSQPPSALEIDSRIAAFRKFYYRTNHTILKNQGTSGRSEHGDGSRRERNRHVVLGVRASKIPWFTKQPVPVVCCGGAAKNGNVRKSKVGTPAKFKPFSRRGVSGVVAVMLRHPSAAASVAGRVPESRTQGQLLAERHTDRGQNSGRRRGRRQHREHHGHSLPIHLMMMR
ncbi:uncharacterized protein LOC143285175 isoform X2 [Babylonia areolata]|uniref:uncharacterized protein LOC143285175 isoform X2 n=1 Tax=Babylonia areolata TaxID=304850 RepID=UPI003FD2A0FB